MRIVIDLQPCQDDSRFRGLGRYSKSLAKEIARQSIPRGHEVWLLLNDNFPGTIDPIKQDFDGLIPAAQIVTFPGMGNVAEFVSGNEWRLRAAEHLRELFLAHMQPDVVHVSSLFEGTVDDAAVTIGANGKKIPTSVTLYDLIPLALKDIYLTEQYIKDYYVRKLASLRRADLLLAISESSRREAIELLGIEADQIVNISTSIDDGFWPRPQSAAEAKALLDRYGISRPFIFYVPGGFDPRKNFGTLIDAFSRLPDDMRSAHQLVIGSSIRPHEKGALKAEISSFSLRDDEVIVTGYIPDDDLVCMYSICELHVFPSLHEGFGLPVLEALACGAPSIASNSTSLPEVIGRTDALFDPTSAVDIAEKIERALSDADFRASLRAHGIAHAKKFSWQRSAETALDAFDSHFRPLERVGPVATSASELERQVLRELEKDTALQPATDKDLALLSDSTIKAAQTLDGIAQSWH
ncbi:glycosyltransferase family 1 protein [Paraburkholderia sp. CNPSo 3076]|uniref:glycosyltransferase family 4 protein n=1 Tax=Paraburkholderia sp. CNPSo 3076 TaxID=2940936 RepID=UPI0022525214|nr:glycosyltransferase family 1 protein [Paraburkholderia sp. CNPSo 3076]MCX5543190.1 glycosyltransferase family 1 protein [Paraburkholderia sp. CNPSo 3076]